MPRFTKRQLKRGLLILGSLALLWLINLLFIGIRPEELSFRGRFQAEKADWEAHPITDYRMVVDVMRPWHMRTHYAITVQMGQIVEARAKVFELDPAYRPENATFEPISIDEASSFSIDALYQMAAANLDHFDTCLWYEGNFDPAQHYLKRFAEHCDRGIGCAIGDCGSLYQIIEFEPLPP